MISHAFKTADKIIFNWEKGLFFYRIEKYNYDTGEITIIVRVPVWKKDAEWLVKNMVKGLEWGRVFR